MSSLRARVLASVLVLAAAGMVALGAVTYAEQSSFLQSRADQQARAAVGALSQALDAAGFRPAGAGEPGGAGGPLSRRDQGRGGGPGANGPLVNLPPGTYGQRRDASGQVIGSRQIQYSTSESLPPTPVIPAQVPLNELLTVGSKGSSGLHYRVYAQADPEDGGVTVVAVPLSEVASTPHRRLLAEALATGAAPPAPGPPASFVAGPALRRRRRPR